MIVLVSYSSGTYRAQIRSSLANGFQQLYTSTCTAAELPAAKAVVRKWFGDAAAGTLRQVTDRTEIRDLVGGFKDDPRRKQCFSYWVFDHQMRPQPGTRNAQLPNLNP